MIDKHILLCPFLLGRFGFSQKTRNFDIVGFLFDRENSIVEMTAENAADTLFEIALLELVGKFAVVVEGEGNVGMDEGHPDKFLLDAAKLSVVGLEEVAACRHVEKEVAHRYAGAVGRGGRTLFLHLAALNQHHRARFILRPLGFQLHMGDSGDGCQSLSSKSFSMNGKQILRAAYLRGGMTLEAEPCIVETHSLAIINHLDERAARILHHQLDVLAALIHRIL